MEKASIKIKKSVWKIPIEAANRCIILTRSFVSNGLITVKLEQDLKASCIHQTSLPICTKWVLI